MKKRMKNIDISSSYIISKIFDEYRNLNNENDYDPCKIAYYYLSKRKNIKVFLKKYPKNKRLIKKTIGILIGFGIKSNFDDQKYYQIKGKNQGREIGFILQSSCEPKEKWFVSLTRFPIEEFFLYKIMEIPEVKLIKFYDKLLIAKLNVEMEFPDFKTQNIKTTIMQPFNSCAALEYLNPENGRFLFVLWKKEVTRHLHGKFDELLMTRFLISFSKELILDWITLRFDTMSHLGNRCPVIVKRFTNHENNFNISIEFRTLDFWVPYDFLSMYPHKKEEISTTFIKPNKDVSIKQYLLRYFEIVTIKIHSLFWYIMTELIDTSHLKIALNEIIKSENGKYIDFITRIDRAYKETVIQLGQKALEPKLINRLQELKYYKSLINKRFDILCEITFGKMNI